MGTKFRENDEKPRKMQNLTLTKFYTFNPFMTEAIIIQKPVH